jgi:hypothetical protein
VTITGRSVTNRLPSAERPGGICRLPRSRCGSLPSRGSSRAVVPWAGWPTVTGMGGSLHRLPGGDGVCAEAALGVFPSSPRRRAGRRRVPGTYGMDLRSWFRPGRVLEIGRLTPVVVASREAAHLAKVERRDRRSGGGVRGCRLPNVRRRRVGPDEAAWRATT